MCLGTFNPGVEFDLFCLEPSEWLHAPEMSSMKKAIYTVHILNI